MVPMPPVLGPCVAVAGALVVHGGDHGDDHVLPSVKDRTETSGPVRNSSMTTLAAALAEDLVLHAWRGRPPRPPPGSCATMTPLPRARPSALTTVGMGRGLEIGQRLVHVVKDCVVGGGNAVFLHQVLGEDLAALQNGGSLVRGRSRECPLASSRVHRAQAPGDRRGQPPRSRSALSLAKAHDGVQILCLDAGAAWRPRRCRRCRERRRCPSRVGLFFRLLMMACSRPPPPTTRIFMETDLPFADSMVEQAHAGKGHDHAVAVRRSR